MAEATRYILFEQLFGSSFYMRKQALWLDQRGTGLSSPVSGELLDDKTDEEKAEYLTHFRADNIGMFVAST